MRSKSTKKTSTSPKNNEPSEQEWVVVDDGALNAESQDVAAEASAEPLEPKVEHEIRVEPDIDDAYQAGPDEPEWTPVEHVAASEDAAAPRSAKKAPRAVRAKPGPVAGKAPKMVTNDVAQEPTLALEVPEPSYAKPTPKRASKRSAAQSDEAVGTSTQDDAGERKGALADERAVGVAAPTTEPIAAAPTTTKRKIQKFVAERAEQRVRERADERADSFATESAADRDRERAVDRASEVAREHEEDCAAERADDVTRERTEDRAAERASDVAAHASQLRPDDLVAPEWDAAPTAATPSALQPMEDFIVELGTLSVAQLFKRHIEALGKAPRIKSRPWLVRKLGWVEQTKRYGGLSIAAKKRLDQLMSEIELPVPAPRAAKPNAKPPKSADDMPVGTRIERKWHGKLIVATRVDGGWDCEGHVFRSLSAAAKAVSGSHVSGPAFFGIWKSKGGAQ